MNSPAAEGMAPAATILSWQDTNDTAEMAPAAAIGAANRIVASNHSHGAIIGWNNAGTNFTNNQNQFGSYTNRSVAFDTVVAGDGAGTAGTELVVVKSAGNDRTAIGNLAPGGYTGIIAGVTEAANQLGSASATNPDDVVFLFSDGRHNRPVGSNVATIDSVMANDTRFFSVGFGTDVNSTVLPGVAANHDGVHLEEQALQAGQLAKLFMVVGGLSTDETIVIDPDYPVEPNDSANQGDSLDTAKIVVLSDSGITLRPGAKVGGINALLTARLIEGGRLLRRGVRVIAHVQPNRPSTGDSEKQDGITLDRPDIQVPDKRPGGMTATPVVTIRRTQPGAVAVQLRGQPAISRPPQSRVRVNPAVSSILTDRAKALALGPEVTAQLQGHFKAPMKPTGIELRDDGTNGDAKASDGIFSVMVALPDKGLYQVRTVATQARPSGTLTREALSSLLIQ